MEEANNIDKYSLPVDPWLIHVKITGMCKNEGKRRLSHHSTSLSNWWTIWFANVAWKVLWHTPTSPCCFHSNSFAQTHGHSKVWPTSVPPNHTVNLRTQSVISQAGRIFQHKIDQTILVSLSKELKLLYQSINQSVTQSINQSCNQSTHQPVNQISESILIMAGLFPKLKVSLLFIWSKPCIIAFS